jgi:choline dehydrogenase-like flavoprotein
MNPWVRVRCDPIVAALGTHERRVLAAVCEVVVPAGRVLPATDATTVARVEDDVARAGSLAVRALQTTLWALDAMAFLRKARMFASLSATDRLALLESSITDGATPVRLGLRALAATVKSAHLQVARPAAIFGDERALPIADEHARWMLQMTDGATVTTDTELEADVVVVGTGAGGAPLAYELAARGHAVLLLEEGRYFGRREFRGRPSDITRAAFRDGGMTFAVGNILAPVWMGVTVGGTTTVNSGTCYRTPPHTLRMWREQLGLPMMTEAHLEPYFDRVERVLGVAPSPEEQMGGGARAVARGAQKLGVHFSPIRRNAPGCDGQGRCVFGCPTGAKRSTNVSYIPMALERGAALFARTRVDQVLVEGARAIGLRARTAGGATLTVHARATVLSCGALMTPLLLRQSGLCQRSRMLGENLSIHPAGGVLALFDEHIDMRKGVPQSGAVDEWKAEGMVLEESGQPPEVAALALPLVGPRFVEVFERYPQLSSFGYMIQDTSRGSVRRGWGGRLSISYSMNEEDTRRFQTCVERLVELYLAAGARAVYPGVRRFDEIRDADGLARLRGARLRAGDFTTSAVHPLGTARMGADPATSVVDPDHCVHGVENLYVVDGSSVPSSLGVNPQITIMALATRAADILAERLKG